MSGEELTARTVRVLAARDQAMKAVSPLETAAALQVLQYVVASYCRHVAKTSRHSAEACAGMFYRMTLDSLSSPDFGTLVPVAPRAMVSPGYWMDEVGGTLRPAIMAYLTGNEMTPEHIAAMRAYLRQWIAAPDWGGPEIAELRASIDTLVSRAAIQAWLGRAEAAGIDPL